MSFGQDFEDYVELRFSDSAFEREGMSIFAGLDGLNGFIRPKVESLVDSMQSKGWVGAPVLFFEKEGRLQVVQGGFRLLAAHYAAVKVESVQIVEDELIERLDGLTKVRDQARILAGSDYEAVFKQHLEESAVFLSSKPMQLAAQNAPQGEVGRGMGY